MRSFGFGVLLAASLFGCAEEIADTALVGEEGSIPSDFRVAAELTGVPAALLLAIARAETGIEMVQGTEEFPGQPIGYGVMGLRGQRVAEAAALIGVDEERVRTDRATNVLATAVLLADYADELGVAGTDVGAWAPVAAKYSGIQNPVALSAYLHQEVYGSLRSGIELEGTYLPPMQVDVDWPFVEDGQGVPFNSDPGAIWTPSPNYSSRGSQSAKIVVIHTCEGGYSGCWSWLTNSASGVSAHYVVNDSGSEVRQLVKEDKKAWHVSATYDCTRNSGQLCSLNGKGTNDFAVGIEHAGYGSQSSWSSGLIARSAKLTCGVTQRNGIPRDSYHILGHGQLQPYNRSDPGANWPWNDYLAKVKEACGDNGSGGSGDSGGTGDSGSTGDSGGTGGTGGSGGGGTGGGTNPTASAFVIDSNNSRNVVSDYYTEVSGAWISSANVPGYYGTGYWVGPNASVADGASFRFLTDSERCYRVEGWWTAGTDRSTNVAFIGFDSAENEVGRTEVNQRTGGSSWQLLGNWRFPAGWNEVLLSRWGVPGTYTVADAVRFTPSSSCP